MPLESLQVFLDPCKVDLLLALQLGKQPARVLVLDDCSGAMVEVDGVRFRLPRDQKALSDRFARSGDLRLHPLFPRQLFQVDEVGKVLLLPAGLEPRDGEQGGKSMIGQPLSRRSFLQGAGIGAAAFAAAGLPRFAHAAREKELNILCWEGYNSAEVLDPFRSTNGATVKAESLTNDPTMINRLRAGETNVWDLINVNNPWARKIMLPEKLIKPLPVAEFEPFFAKMMPEFKAPYKWAMSDDGSQLLGMAQRFGPDFDGIVSISPAVHWDRWGFSAGAWFWIPGRRWGPAWVSWAYSPGYVSWCPLGWDNRPIVQIINVYTRGYDPWHAWTVIPRRHFGYGAVHANVVPRHVIDTRLRGTFVHRATAPEVVGYAVPRATAPIRVAGTRRDPGSRRGDSTVYTNLSPDQSRVRTPGARVTVDPGAGTSAPRAVPRSAAGVPPFTTWLSSGSSPTSSRKIVPPSARVNRPSRLAPGVANATPRKCWGVGLADLPIPW